MIAKMKTAFIARQSQWRDRWGSDLTKPVNQRQAWLDMALVDHGFLRVAWRNLEEFAPGAWRSNQPSPSQLRRLARRGLATIINLRGASNLGSYRLERMECEALGIEMIDARLFSRDPPTPEQVDALFDVFERARKPLLMHCKSGADRAGLGAALYLLWAGETPQTAARQLSLRYLHVRQAKTGVLDAFIEDYANAYQATGIGFRDWLHTQYDRDALKARHEANRLGNLLVDRVLNRE